MAPSRSSPDAGKTEGKSSGRKPVVFMFQPTKFAPVHPSKMQEWEEGLRASLGENAPKVHQLLREGGFLETTSICVPGGNDDCDIYEGDIGVL